MEAGLVGGLLSVLVLKWPRLAGLALLLVATAELVLVTGASVGWSLQVAGPLFFVAAVLAEAARRPDGHPGFVLRVAAEIVAVPLVVVVALVVWLVSVLSVVCRGSGTC
jgi:hypothetical protein